MSIRKVKDARDLSTNELIYFKGHAKATFMSDGKTVEEAINQIGTSGGGGGITTETDPIFSASAAASITEGKKAEWDAKYTKPSGGIPASDLAPDVFLQGEKGDKGDKGDTGATGANGTNGKDGADGEDGATFTPSVDANGNLSWTNNKGLSNPPTVNIKGPKGDSGEGGGGSSSYPVADIYIHQVDEDGINPNIYYKVIDVYEGEVLYVTLNEPTDNSIVNEYVLEFYIIPPNMAGTPAIVLPDTVVWANGKIPPMTGGKTYVVSIVNNLAVFAEF